MKRAEEVLGVAPHEIDFERARLAMLRTLQQMQAESRREAAGGVTDLAISQSCFDTAG